MPKLDGFDLLVKLRTDEVINFNEPKIFKFLNIRSRRIIYQLETTLLTELITSNKLHLQKTQLPQQMETN